jgi:hypothetical protein
MYDASFNQTEIPHISRREDITRELASEGTVGGNAQKAARVELGRLLGVGGKNRQGI